MWYNQLPSWVANGQFTAADLTTVIQNHCSTLVSHYKGQVCTYISFLDRVTEYDVDMLSYDRLVGRRQR